MGIHNELEKQQQVRLPSSEDMMIIITATLNPPQAYGLDTTGYVWTIIYRKEEFTSEEWSTDLIEVVSDAYINAARIKNDFSD